MNVRILKNIVLLLIPLWMWSCDEEMMDYEGKDGVYFMMQKAPVSGYGDPENFEYVDTTHVSFASIVGADTVLPIRVRVMGDVKEYDRHVSMQIVAGESTAVEGEDYEGFDLSQSVKAKERQVEIPCRIIRPDKLAKENLVLSLVIQLLENDDFSLPLVWWQPFGNIYGDVRDSVNVVRHVILIDNIVKMPNVWKEAYWGKWSVKKFTIMCDLFKMTWDDFNALTLDQDSRLRIMGQNLDRYLKEKEADGETIYEEERDENGDLVKMTAGSQI